MKKEYFFGCCLLFSFLAGCEVGEITVNTTAPDKTTDSIDVTKDIDENNNQADVTPEVCEGDLCPDPDFMNIAYVCDESGNVTQAEKFFPYDTEDTLFTEPCITYSPTNFPIFKQIQTQEKFTAFYTNATRGAAVKALIGLGQPEDVAQSTAGTELMFKVIDGVAEGCGSDDGTCISGTIDLAGIDITENDIPEAWLFATPKAKVGPIMSYTDRGAEGIVNFKIVQIPDSAVETCKALFLGARVDHNGNNQYSGNTDNKPQDPQSFKEERIELRLTKGCQVNGLTIAPKSWKYNE
jgi:hypothetical protein